MMIRRATLATAVVLALLGAGCGSSSSSGSGNESADEVVVTLAEQNGSAESGTATLTAEGDRTRVVLEVQSKSATPVATPQPAHIHKGSCDELDPTPAYGLNDVQAGKSTSTVDAKLTDLRNGDFAINVRESAEQIETYVACGVVGTGDGKGNEPPPGYDY
jgi:Cu/Zn superoxide dismutase